MAHDIFISYSRRDADVANTIRETLESAGIHCWIDTRDERSGLGWAEQVVAAVKASRAVVLIHSRHTAKSQVLQEIAVAEQIKRPVIPVRVDGTPMAGGGLEYLIGRIQWIDASEGLEPKLPRLVGDVTRFVGAETKAVPESPESDVAMSYPAIDRRRAAPVATEDVVRLPGAEWTINDDDHLRVRLLRREDEISRLRAAIARMRTLDRSQILIQCTITPRGTMEADLREWRPYAQVAAEWREDLAIAIPSIVRLGRTIADLCRLNAAAGGVLLPLSPLYLFRRKTTGEWGAVPIPAADVTLFEWAGADPIAWSWASAESLVGSRGADDRYAVGAALHETLTGSLFAPLLPPTERFRRVLSGRVGLPQLLDSVIEAAVPPSYEEEKKFFRTVVDAHLTPPLVDRAAGAASDALLDELGERLAPHRLALRWEFENRIDHALLLLERYASKDVLIGQVWQAMARIFIKKGEPERATEIVVRALDSGDIEAIRHYLSIVPLSRTPAEVIRDNLRRAIRAASMNGSASDELSSLLLAHVEARHLRDTTSAINRLQRRTYQGWPAVLSHLVLARALAENDEQYPVVSRLATEACQMLRRLQYDSESRYAEAYLRLLNGIVNYAAVGKFNSPSFLADSFQSFFDSLECSLREVIAPLITANVQWLQWIAASARLMPGPEYSLMNAGISAYLQARGLSQREAVKDMRFPVIPWYDENLLFHIEEAP